MFKKIVALGLVCLFLAVSFVAAEENIGPYNPNADVNRDGTVDILDLAEVGQAYGSNYTLKTQTDRTIITVLSFDKDPPEVEGARVAVFVEGPPSPFYAIDAKYTNSSGIAVFELSPNITYMAVGWNSSSYNYVNFDTDSFGEASVMILLGEPANPSMRKLPKNHTFVAVLNRTTSLFHNISGYAEVVVDRLWWTYPEGWQTSEITSIPLKLPVFRLISPQTGTMSPNTGYGIIVYYQGQLIGSSTFQTDVDTSANVIVYTNS